MPSGQAAVGDLDALLALAREAGPGMTNLPADHARLAERLDGSVAALAAQAPPNDAAIILVAELGGHVVGCAGVFPRVGESRPFYSFRVTRLPHSSRELGRFESVDVLQMVDEYSGASELGMLYLSSPHRRGGNGSVLSRSRFLLIASRPTLFAARVFAEMRGVSDQTGRSPFWDAVGRHFFDMDFVTADRFSAAGHHQFIADLMPKHPVYVRLLPAAAQQVIGEPHPNTAPALSLLEREGFRYEGCVDVFDAGPTVHCPRDQIRTIAASERVQIADIGARSDTSATCLVATQAPHPFRLVAADVVRDERGIGINDRVAAALGVEVGQTVLIASRRRPRTDGRS
ncbi:MAG: arginine N-succinyltransferase [Pseudomonadota bacterium]